MNLDRAAQCLKNARKRLSRQNESVIESSVRRTNRNESDRQRAARRTCIRDDSSVPEHNCGELNKVCEFCGALFWNGELNTTRAYTKCCHSGKVAIPQLNEPPEVLKELLTKNDAESKNYRQHIREYNASLAFASMGASVKPPPGLGPYCFRIHGQIYHMASPLYASSGNKAGYGQLYVFDSSEATEKRLDNNATCLETVMHKLDSMLRCINPFANSYAQMHELIQNNPATDVKMVFMEDNTLDLRRYNAPTSKTDVAAIFVGDNGEPPAHRDICIYPHGEGCRKISPMNRCTDPMVYPLLFPSGEFGWNSSLEHTEERRTTKRVRVTQQEFYAYRLAIRRGFSILHNSGKLLQQYIVDAYVKTEGSRLNYLRFNQKGLRIELYSGLLDALQARANAENMRTGKLIILPSSFQGSPRHMQQNYQDAMAIVRKYGRPDLFVTFTCNPAWPEIRDALQDQQRVENRPDITVRVFKMKLAELLNDVLKRNLFGVVKAYVYVIEFQKRGLPHAHILLTLDESSKIRTKDDIDKFVSAEIPDSEREPRLFEIVTKCMIHGPCGTLNPKSPCMKENVCSKDFPKEFREATEENVNGYPIYQRKPSAPIKVGKHDIDNRWVVPYNPWLLKKFNAHINVEVCASVKSVKYLYKYVYKGHDAASISLQHGTMNHDEIQTFLDGRYVSAPEAMWRLNEFSMSEKSHTIIRLAVHTPNQQQIVYVDGQEEQAAIRAASRKTTLTAMFELNQRESDARNLTYSDLPHHYVFEISGTKWKKRQRGGQQVIGRMPVVSIQDSERYYLRMLLLRKKGAMSFDDLRTVDGIVCETFQQACRMLGLLEGDSHWHDALREAALSQMPSQLRLLFAMICAFGEVENVLEIWEQYCDSLAEDFTLKHGATNGPQYALAEIDGLLKSYGLNLSKVNLPIVNISPSSSTLLAFDSIEEQNKAQRNMSMLNTEQREVVETVIRAIYENGPGTPKRFFLDGPAGTGKTFIYSTLLHYIRGKGDRVTAVASTGIAATLLIGGRTAHSVFKIPILLNATSTCNLKPNTNEAKLLLDTKLIVWDEAPMTHIHAFIAVDRLLQDLTKCCEPFGGKVVLFGGDFRQVLPVIMRGSRSLTVASCLKKHSLWEEFTKITLTKNMRALESEREFSSWLLEVGEAKHGDTIDLPSICYPTVQDPIQQLYGDLDLRSVTAKQLKDRAILTVTNDISINLNNLVLDRLPGDKQCYDGIDTIISDDPNDQLLYTEEFLNSLTPTGMPPCKLYLKPGCIIMLLRNLAPAQGLCNGTRLIVTKLQRNIIEAKRIDSGNTETVFIPRLPLIPSDSNMPFKFKRRQFPIRLAFAMTINKSQGQTFEKICLMLPKPVFSHGQLYVAMSRVRAFSSVTVVAPCSKIFNCVYKEVFEN